MDGATIGDLRRAIERLRGPANRQGLCDATAGALTACLGFGRGLVLCTADERPLMISAAVADDRAAAGALVAEAADRGLALPEDGPERDALRRRRAVLGDGGRSCAVAVRGPYAVAPILEDGRPVGLLHGDREQGRPVDAGDLVVLEAFASAVGLAFERAGAQERARRQAHAVRHAAAALEAVADDALAPARSLLPRTTAPGRSDTPVARLAQALTRRELEVLELLAAGATNQRIAEELVLSHGTVKTHVKHILRKLRVANRAQAAALYSRFVARS